MKKSLLILCVLVGLSGVSNATTIDYLTKLDLDGVLTTTFVGAIVEDFNDGFTWTGSGNGQITPAASYTPTGVPYNSTLMIRPDKTPYLSVPNPASSGIYTFTFTTDYTYFGLFWGSIDTYNTLSFWKDGSMVESYAGSVLPVPSGEYGNQSSDRSNLYVNFYDINSGLGFDEVQLFSSQSAFEVDNLAVGAPVPEPATMLLFGIGILGLAGVSRRKKR